MTYKLVFFHVSNPDDFGVANEEFNTREAAQAAGAPYVIDKGDYDFAVVRSDLVEARLRLLRQQAVLTKAANLEARRKFYS